MSIPLGAGLALDLAASPRTVSIDITFLVRQALSASLVVGQGETKR